MVDTSLGDKQGLNPWGSVKASGFDSSIHLHLKESNMSRELLVSCLDRMPRLARHDRGNYRDGKRISWTFNGHANDSRSYLVKDGNDWNSWWNDYIDIVVEEDGSLIICDENGWFTKEKLFIIMPDDVKEDFLFCMDVLQ